MLDLVMKLLWRLIIHAGLKLGACSTCRAHKIHCEVAPGATICKRCERSGQGAACILGASRTRSTRSSSTPPADSQIVHPVPVHGRKRSNSTRSCSERSSGVHQPTKKIMEGEAQCTGTRGKEGRAVGNLSMLTSYSYIRCTCR